MRRRSPATEAGWTLGKPAGKAKEKAQDGVKPASPGSILMSHVPMRRCASRGGAAGGTCTCSTARHLARQVVTARRLAEQRAHLFSLPVSASSTSGYDVWWSRSRTKTPRSDPRHHPMALNRLYQRVSCAHRARQLAREPCFALDFSGDKRGRL